MGHLSKNHRTRLLTCGLAALALFAFAGPGAAQTMTRSAVGGSTIGGSGLGSSGLGGGGLGSGGLGGGGLGSGGLGSGGLGSGGLGSGGLGSGGLGSSGLGSSGLGGTGLSFSGGGSFSGSLGSSSLGSVNRSFGGGAGYGGGYGGGFGGGYGASGAASLNSGISAASYAGVASSNLFGNYYANPLAAGLGSSGTQSRFGSPLYTVSTATTGGLTGTAGVTTNAYGTSGIGGSYGGGRARIYVVGGEGLRPPVPNLLQLRADLQQVLARSSALPSKDSMQVLTDGNVVVLRGTVGSETEKRLAEALLRLTPGVGRISNELQVQSR